MPLLLNFASKAYVLVMSLLNEAVSPQTFCLQKPKNMCHGVCAYACENKWQDA